MYKIETTQIPEDFGMMLKAKQSTNWHYYAPLHDIKNPFYFLIRHVLNNLDPKSNINDIIRTLGWGNFRNRIAHSYLHKAKTNQFSQDSQFEFVLNIQKLEEKYNKIIDPKSSRCFLFFFIKQLGIFSKQLDSTLDIPDNVSNFLLTTISGKLEFFDWTALIIWKLMDFYDEQTLKEFLIKYPENPYSQLIYHLAPNQKFDFYDEMIHYAYCIEEKDMFFKFFTK